MSVRPRLRGAGLLAATVLVAGCGSDDTPSVQQGNALVLEDETLVNAFSSGSAPGTRYALENAVPLFAETLA
jgi:hypothetical protein